MDGLLASTVVKVKGKPGKAKKYKFKKVVVPARAPGDAWLLLVTDSADAVAERNEANNVAFSDRTLEWT